VEEAAEAVVEVGAVEAEVVDVVVVEDPALARAIIQEPVQAQQVPPATLEVHRAVVLEHGRRMDVVAVTMVVVRLFLINRAFGHH
jgi:hypothetical protein